MSTKPSDPEQTPWFLSWGSMGTRAWSLLENSESIRPALGSPDGFRYGLPWMRMWDDAMGFGCEIEPFTLTVFHPFLPGDQPIVRKATWERTPDLRRLHELVERQGQVVSIEPTITVKDAIVPVAELNTILRSGLSLRVPVVRLSEAMSVTSDVGSVGFDFYTLDQPQAKVSLEWSFDPPGEWKAAIEFVARIQALLEDTLRKG